MKHSRCLQSKQTGKSCNMEKHASMNKAMKSICNIKCFPEIKVFDKISDCGLVHKSIRKIYNR